MSFEFLIEMAWKSALIAGVALALAATLRSRAAADRSAVLRVAVTLLLLLPLFSLILPKLQIEAWAAEPAEAIAAASPADFSAAAMPAATPAPRAAEFASAPSPEPMRDDPSLLFLILYLGGVAMAGARLGAGLWTLRRWTKAAREIDCPQWNEAFERARWAADAPRGLRLLVSDEAPSPLSWGLARPVILIDRDTLDEPEDADAILAHEIAHVVRRDWAVLMLTRIAAALFWFNPLVWLLEREVVQQAEEAADIEAALCVEPARYAQTLVHWAQFSAGALVPANSIAPSASALSRRVRAILDARRRSAQAGSPWALAATAGCALFAVTLAVLQLIPAVAEARDGPRAPAAPASVPAAPPSPAAVAAAPIPPGAAPPLVVIGAAAPAAPPPPLAAKLALHPHPAYPAVPPAAPAPAPLPPIVDVDEAAIARHVEAAVAVATRMAAVETRRIAAEATAAARRGIAAGAVGIERGAEGLSDGARRMEQEADQLGSARYRERRIAEAAARGEHLTHQELIALSRDLRDGARGMRAGARDMRRAAAEMRREGRD
ncbi:MAG TPA: M56 family metallopeptidase [Allosphingosinicella sp.]|jgi:beta-lactamase regulating signal transducer with metallopeptidase domain